MSHLKIETSGGGGEGAVPSEDCSGPRASIITSYQNFDYQTLITPLISKLCLQF